MRRHSIRKHTSFFPLLITLLSLVNAQIPQHRVKRGTREVWYRELSENEQSSKFWIPNSLHSPRDSPTDTYVRNSHHASPEESSLLWKVDDDSWHLHVDASGSTSRRRRLVDSFIEIDISEKKLVEDDPNQGSITGVDQQNVTWNVSTEIDYGVPVNETSTNSSSSAVYTISETEGNVTSSDPYQPIRIRAILSESEGDSSHLNETQRSFLLHGILSPAVLAWSAALRVNRVVGNLTVDQSQLSDGVSCGPGLGSGHPSVAVPSEHMTSGIPDTDFVVYLSLSLKSKKKESEILDYPAGAPTKDNSGRSLNGKTKGVLPDDSGPFGIRYNVSQEYLNHNRDKQNDLYCSGDFIAASTYCSTDQYDRPTAAILHICIGDDFFNETNLKRNIVTVMHELGHSLGFNPQSMAHFRSRDGKPLTERDKDGNVVDREVECSGPQETRDFAKVPLPSEGIIQFKTVRGGVRVAAVVTPSVLQVVRNHFDCQNLTGAELESGYAVARAEEESATTCIGDHWERRLFRTDLMNAIIDEVPFSLRISPITLALFADSGWYQVDLSRTSYVEGWGRGAGCAFVNEGCISNDGLIAESNLPFFCNEVADVYSRGIRAQIQGCSPDMSRKAVCSIAKYESELPSVYQYFNGTFGANVGGDEPLLDYCPVYMGFSNGECTEKGNRRLLSVSNIEEFGARNSRCLTGRIAGRGTGLCLPIACVVEDRSLRVQVDGTWQTCSHAGQELMTKDGLSTTVRCPDAIRTCPTFYCDRDCLGTGGICMYETGECLCTTPAGNTTVYGNCSQVGVSLSGIFYEDPLVSNSTDTEPHLREDSPLADYYVPNERSLVNRRRRILLIPYFVGAAVLFLFGVFVSAGLIRYKKDEAFRDRVNHSRSQLSLIMPRFLNRGDADDGDINRGPTISFRVNKDKFVASMLVDLRVHHPQNVENASIPDTSAETDSNGNFTRSEMDDDMVSVASDAVSASIAGQIVEEEPLDLPYQIRRRFIRELV